MRPSIPLWLSSRRRRLPRVAAQHAAVRLRYFLLLAAVCCSPLVLLIGIELAGIDKPPGARTLEEWEQLLRSADLSTRTEAVQEVSRLATLPDIPCGLATGGLTDAAPVRLQSVADSPRAAGA